MADTAQRTDSGVSRECPNCGADAVVSRKEAFRVFTGGRAVRTCETYDAVTHVCTKCGAYLQDNHA